MLIKAGKKSIYCCCCLLLFDMNVCCCVVVNGLLVSHNIVVDDERYVVRTVNPSTVTKLAKRIFSRLGNTFPSSNSTTRDDPSVMHGKDTTETSSLLVVQSLRLPPAGSRRVVMSLLMAWRVIVPENGFPEQLVYLKVVLVVRLSEDDSTVVSKRKVGSSQEPHPS